jgi:hypothetical protein
MMGKSNLYEETVDLWHTSVLTNGVEYRHDTSLTELRESNDPILRAFAADDDIQFLKIGSANYGMLQTYQKRYKAKTQ